MECEKDSVIKMENQNRIELIDYLKAICVLMVIITHYEWSDKTTPFFTMLINMAVPIFMILSGYNFAMSNRKKTDGKLRQMYGWKMIKPKLIRFLIPFFTVCIIEIVLLAMEGKNIHPARIFLLGAYGPGSYYVPIMLQLLVVFPIIYFLVERNTKLGIGLAAAANLAFEIVVVVTEMDVYYYRLCIGRYLLLIAFGCYLYLHPEERVQRYQMIIMFLAGLGYIIYALQMEKELVIFDYWSTTAMPVALYIFPIVILLFRKFYHSRIPGKAGELLIWIGKASYHIFLVQMVYYHFELGGKVMEASPWIAVPFNIIICVPIGLLFYELDHRFIRELKQVKKKLQHNFA